MKSFIISTDSCSDHFKNFLEQHGVYSITLKRILNGAEISEHYNSSSEVDAFYDTLKSGATPYTDALKQHELYKYFTEILKKENTGDIIHISLSSGLSPTYENAVRAAAELNTVASGRKIYIIDSLIAALGMDQLIDELIKLRDSGSTSQEAVKRIEELRNHQQGWIIMSDMSNLKRGGRINGVKATIGTILNIKPVLVITKKGKLVIQNKIRGNKDAIGYILGKITELGENANETFRNNTLYLARTSSSPLYQGLKAAIYQKYPKLKIQESIVNPIIGTHLGCGTAIVLFEGARRLNI